MAIGISAATAAWVSAGVSAASAVAAGYQQQQQAKQQEAYRKQQNEIAKESMLDQYSELSAAEKESRTASLEQKQENQDEYQKRKAKLNLMAAASGTGGLSVDSMMQDLKAERGRNINAIVHNQEVELDKFRSKSEAIRTQTKSRVDNRKIKKPSWGSIGLNAAAQGVSSYAGAGGFGKEPDVDSATGRSSSRNWTNSVQTGGV